MSTINNKTNNRQLSKTDLSNIQKTAKKMQAKQAKAKTITGSTVVVGSGKKNGVLKDKGVASSPEPKKPSAKKQTKAEEKALQNEIKVLSKKCDKSAAAFKKMMRADGKKSQPRDRAEIRKDFKALVDQFKALRDEVDKLDSPAARKKTELSAMREEVLECLNLVVASEWDESAVLDALFDAPDSGFASLKDINLTLDALNGWLVSGDPGSRDDTNHFFGTIAGCLRAPGPDASIDTLSGAVEKLDALMAKMPDARLTKDQNAALTSMLAEVQSDCVAALANKYLSRSGDAVPPDGESADFKTAREHLESLLSSDMSLQGQSEEKFNDAKANLLKERSAFLTAVKGAADDLPGPVAEKVGGFLHAKLEKHTALLDEIDNLSALREPPVTGKGSHDKILKRREAGAEHRARLGRMDNRTLQGLEKKIKDATVGAGWKKDMGQALKDAAVTGKLPAGEAKDLAAFVENAATGKQKAALAAITAKLANAPEGGVELSSAEALALMPILERGITEDEAAPMLENLARTSEKNFKVLSAEIQILGQLAEKTDSKNWPPYPARRMRIAMQQAERTLLPGQLETFKAQHKKAVDSFQEARFRELNKDDGYLGGFTNLNEAQKKTLEDFCRNANCDDAMLNGIETLNKGGRLPDFLDKLGRGGDDALVALDMLMEDDPTIQDDVLTLKLHFGEQGNNGLDKKKIEYRHRAACEGQQIRSIFKDPKSVGGGDLSPEARDLLDKLQNSPLSEVPKHAAELLRQRGGSDPKQLIDHLDIRQVDLLLLRAAYHDDQGADEPSADFEPFFNKAGFDGGDVKTDAVTLRYLEQRMDDTMPGSVVKAKVEKAIGGMSKAISSQAGMDTIVKTLARDPQQAQAERVLRDKLVALLKHSPVPEQFMKNVDMASTDELLEMAKLYGSVGDPMEGGDSAKLAKFAETGDAADKWMSEIANRRGAITPKMEKALADIDKHLPPEDRIMARGHVRFSKIHGQQMATGIFALNMVLNDEEGDWETLKKQAGTLHFQSHLDFHAMRGCTGPLAEKRGFRGTEQQNERFTELLNGMKNATSEEDFNKARDGMKKFYKEYNLGDKAETLIALQGKSYRKAKTFDKHRHIKSSKSMDMETVRTKHLDAVKGKVSSSVKPDKDSGQAGTDFLEKVNSRIETELFGGDQERRSMDLAHLAWAQHQEKKEWKSAMGELRSAQAKKSDAANILEAAAGAAVTAGFREVPGADFGDYLDKAGREGTPEHKACIASIKQFTGCTDLQAKAALRHTVHDKFTKSEVEDISIPATVGKAIGGRINVPGLLVGMHRLRKGEAVKGMTRTEIDKVSGKAAPSRDEIAKSATELCKNRLKPGKSLAIDIRNGGGFFAPIPAGDVYAQVGVNVARERGMSISVDDDGNVSFALAKGFSGQIDASVNIMAGVATLAGNLGVEHVDGVVLEFKNDGVESGRDKFTKFFTAFCAGEESSPDLGLYTSVETFAQNDIRAGASAKTDLAAITTAALSAAATAAGPGAPVALTVANQVFKWNPISVSLKAEVAGDWHFRKGDDGQTNKREQQVNISLAGTGEISINLKRPVGAAMEMLDEFLTDVSLGQLTNGDETLIKQFDDLVKAKDEEGMAAFLKDLAANRPEDAKFGFYALASEDVSFWEKAGKMAISGGMSIPKPVSGVIGDQLAANVNITGKESSGHRNKVGVSGSVDLGRVQGKVKFSVKATGLCSQSVRQGKLNEATQTFSQPLGFGKNSQANMAAVVGYYGIRNEALMDRMDALTLENKPFTLNVTKEIKPEVMADINRTGGPDTAENKKRIADEANFIVSGYAIEYTDLEVSSNVGFNIVIVQAGLSTSGRDMVRESFSP